MISEVKNILNKFNNVTPVETNSFQNSIFAENLQQKCDQL